MCARLLHLLKYQKAQESRPLREACLGNSQASWQDAGGKTQDEWQAGLIKEGLWCEFVFVMTMGL